MASSLEKLAENLYDKEDKYKNFHNMKREFPDHIDLLCKKGHYPYEWVDSHDKLNNIGLPSIENFYSELKKESISEKDYEHAQHVYETMGCKRSSPFTLKRTFCFWRMSSRNSGRPAVTITCLTLQSI